MELSRLSFLVLIEGRAKEDSDTDVFIAPTNERFFERMHDIIQEILERGIKL